MKTEVIDAPPKGAPIGDGKHGILEGYSAEIGPDGSQRQRLLLRSDCVSESAMAFAVTGRSEGRCRCACDRRQPYRLPVHEIRRDRGRAR